LASIHSDHEWSISLDQALAYFESCGKSFTFSCPNEFVFKRESSISWILPVGIYESVSNGDTLEVDLKIILMFEKEVVSNGWDVMSSI